MTLRVDFTSQEYLRDPAAALRALRASGPIVQTRFPIIGKVWITTTQEMAGRVLKDSATFTLRKDGGGPAGLRWWMPPALRSLANNMLTVDEPDHTRLRQIVEEAFPRRAILEMEPHILALAEQLAGELFAKGSPADLVERYARKLPLAVICEPLGLPLADRAKFIAWANRVGRIAGPVGLIRMVAGLWNTISAWATSSPASRAGARSRPCSSAGRNSTWPFRRTSFAGGSGPASGLSTGCRSWHVPNGSRRAKQLSLCHEALPGAAPGRLPANRW
jgi:cytochrome P450